ncbi:hypothetical protein I6N96_18955 [Enterococcus sp. BWM-S5]|uniref:Uncharacterized protein n=1 Tax=Enterococcus larvae TaxID=2794352 RepID=A0ABS4CP68_9ENTE|nr:hypothetical protein [Enterococcus larvae]MBP1048377.1 hypothetical protein [Enterococcus larvae]
MSKKHSLQSLAILLKELFYLLKKYDHSSYNARQVENILAIIYEEENPKKYSEIYSCLKGLYFPKAGLSEFYISADQSSDWRMLNQRLAKISEELEDYEQIFEKYQ